MKKNSIALLFLLAACASLLPAQLWQSVGGGCSGEVRGYYDDSTNGLLYVVGAFNRAGDSIVRGIGTWDGQSWREVGEGTGDTLGPGATNPILSVVKYGGSLFAGGTMFFMEGNWGIKFLSRWDGQQWNECGDPNSAAYLDIANGRLFALGGFTEISGRATKKISEWNGTEWVRFGDSLPFDQYGGLSSAEYYRGEYYFAGHVKIGAEWKCIIRWTGSAWEDVGGGDIDLLNNIVAYKGQLFLGGEFHAGAGNPASYLMAWDGTRRYDPFPKVQFSNIVQDLKVIDDQLYIVGNHFVYDDGLWKGPYNLCKYDGQNFCSFGGKYLWTLGIAGFQDDIYVSTGSIINPFGADSLFPNGRDTVNYIAKWLGGDSVDVCISQPVRVQDPHSANEASVSLHPNPTHSQIILTLPPQITAAELQIRDLQGRVVLPPQRCRAAEQVDVSALPAGLYFVSLRWRDAHAPGGERVEVLKMVKE